MGEYRGMKALEMWCKRITEGYPGVKVENMTTSWRDGLAFCAIINHFRPDLIDFTKLNKDDIFRNNELAFRIAQQYLGIPALLDAEDMVEYPVPDRLSILTYLSQFYQALACTSGNGPSRISPKRPTPAPERNMVLPSSTSPPAKMAVRSNIASVQQEQPFLPRRETCVQCKLPVFLVERVLVGKQLYHAGCFRCARCDQPMSAGNYYEMEEGGGYCCEVCPKDETMEAAEQVVPKRSVLECSMSDEPTFHTTAHSALKSPVNSDYSKARSFFMQGLIAEKPPPLPASKPPDEEVYDNNESDGCLPTTDSLKLSVSVNNSVKDWDHSRDVCTKEIQPETDNDSVILVPNADDSVVVISDESQAYILISDDSNITKSFDDYITPHDNKDVIELTHENIVVDTDVSLGRRTSSPPKDEETKELVAKPRLKKLQPRVSDYKTTTGSTGDTPEIYKSVYFTRESLPPTFHLPETPTPTPRDTCNLFSSNVKEEEEEQHEEKISLNPFSDDEDEEDVLETPKLENMSTNPFDDDEDDENIESLSASSLQKEPSLPDYKLRVHQSPSTTTTTPRESSNPFSSDEDEIDEYQIIMKPKREEPLRKVALGKDAEFNDIKIKYKRESILPTYQTPDFDKKAQPRISLNPFSSDEDDTDELPVATNGSLSSVAQHRTSFGSTASLASTASSSVNSTYRKKKPAPKPPIPTFGTQGSSANSSPHASITSSPSTSAQHSPRPRKAKRAPLPPTLTAKATSTPIAIVPSEVSTVTVSPIRLDYEKGKVEKDEANRHTQTQSMPTARDKSTYGKWKRKKHQAPSLPVPQKRTIKALPKTELKKELDIIEVQLQGLSKQGVRLEKIIRDQCEGPDADPNATEVPIEAEDLILQLFEVVNEKNELCRRQAELMYLKRQHRLEVEQADIEYQIRVLMMQSCKTDSEKAQEAELIARLVEIVDMRAEIVECLEMDRVRGVEEDDSIMYSMNSYANKRDEAAAVTLPSSNESSPKKDKKKKLRKLLKFKKFSAGHKMDADKDVDESETHSRSIKSKKKK